VLCRSTLDEICGTAQYAAVPQCDAASYTVLLKLRVVPFESFIAGIPIQQRKFFPQRFYV